MRTRTGFAVFLVVVLLVLAATPAFAQKDKSKRPSPPASAQCKFADGKKITIDYSSPRMHDPKTGQLRKIYGELVPWDKAWRTGANEATTFVTDANLSVGGASVLAGNYTLYTLPSEKGAWKLIISKTTGQWGIPYPGEAEDLARTDMKKERIEIPVENFLISFNQAKPDACTLRLDWENTRVSVDITEKK